MIVKLCYHQNRAAAKSKFSYLFAVNYISWPIIWIIISAVLLPVQILCKIDNFLSGLTCQALCCETQGKYHRVHLLCTHLSFHLEIILMQYPKEFMRGVSVFTRLVGTVAGALSALPHVQKTIGKCPLHKHRSGPKCVCMKSSLPGMPAYALSRLCAFGCSKSDAFLCVSDFLPMHRSAQWHIDSYCYPR